MKGHSSSAGRADGIDVEICHPYVVEARRGMLFEQTDERHGELGQRSSYLRLERGRKDERFWQEEGLSACARRHALSKWCRVIEIASKVSRLIMSLGR